MSYSKGFDKFSKSCSISNVFFSLDILISTLFYKIIFSFSLGFSSLELPKDSKQKWNKIVIFFSKYRNKIQIICKSLINTKTLCCNWLNFFTLTFGELFSKALYVTVSFIHLTITHHKPRWPPYHRLLLNRNVLK